MKAIASVGLATLIVLGGAINLWAYEGATKGVAIMAFRDENHAVSDRTMLVPSDYLRGTKPVANLTHRLPEPSLSTERIREEMPGPTTGTKRIVLFQENRI